MNKKYDSTVARIAGNIMSGHKPVDIFTYASDLDRDRIMWAVDVARRIVVEVRRTEPEVKE